MPSPTIPLLYQSADVFCFPGCDAVGKLDVVRVLAGLDTVPQSGFSDGEDIADVEKMQVTGLRERLFSSFFFGKHVHIAS